MSSSANPLVAAKAALAHANKVFPSGFAKVATGATGASLAPVLAHPARKVLRAVQMKRTRVAR